MGRIKKLQEYLEKVVLMPPEFISGPVSVQVAFVLVVANYFLLYCAGEKHCEAWMLTGCS